MQSQLLISNQFALEECATLQPNSRSWHNETGFAPLGGMFAAPMGYLLDATLLDATGELRPVDGFAMQHTRKGSGMAGGGGLWLGTGSVKVADKCRFAQAGGMMRQEFRPIIAQTQIGDF